MSDDIWEWAEEGKRVINNLLPNNQFNFFVARSGSVFIQEIRTQPLTGGPFTITTYELRRDIFLEACKRMKEEGLHLTYITLLERVHKIIEENKGV